jgi:hypothetical protein
VEQLQRSIFFERSCPTARLATRPIAAGDAVDAACALTTVALGCLRVFRAGVSMHLTLVGPVRSQHHAIAVSDAEWACGDHHRRKAEPVMVLFLSTKRQLALEIRSSDECGGGVVIGQNDVSNCVPSRRANFSRKCTIAPFLDLPLAAQWTSATTMFQFVLPSAGPAFGEEAAEIERFRACQRRLRRGQQQTASSSAAIASLDVDDGRARKISSKWRQRQQQSRVRRQREDGAWPQSAGTEMHVGFNAFDFSSSPEAFCEDPAPAKPAESNESEARMAKVAKQVSAMGFNSASLWESGHPAGQTSLPPCLWQPPAHFTTFDDQRRGFYGQPQHYAA